MKYSVSTNYVGVRGIQSNVFSELIEIISKHSNPKGLKPFVDSKINLNSIKSETF